MSDGLLALLIEAFALGQKLLDTLMGYARYEGELVALDVFKDFFESRFEGCAFLFHRR